MTPSQIAEIIRPYYERCLSLRKNMDVLCRLVGGEGGPLEVAVFEVMAGYTGAIAALIGTHPDLIEEWLYEALEGGEFRFQNEWPDGSVTKVCIGSVESLSEFIAKDQAAHARSLN